MPYCSLCKTVKLECSSCVHARWRKGYSLIWPIQGCAAGQGMVCVLSVLNRVYNFARVCPKQGQFPLSLSKTVCMICASAFVPSRSNDCNMIFSIAIAINDFKTTRRAFCPLS